MTQARPANAYPGVTTFVVTNRLNSDFWSVERGWTDYHDADHWTSMEGIDLPPNGEWLAETITLDPPGHPVGDSSFRAEARRLRHLLSQCGDERQRYYEALLNVRKSIVDHATDTVWMSSGIETVVDHISAAIGETG